MVVVQAKKIIFIFFFLILSFYNVFAEVKGSETAVSVESAYQFPAADSNNTMLGFAWFKNGFSLEDNTTTCTFDSVYPVSGNINLNGGTLYLAQDLIFKNKTTLLGLGTIVGGDHVCEFCSSIKTLPTGQTIFQDLEISLTADLVITDTIVLRGDCKIFGDKYDIVLGQNGYIFVDVDSSLHLADITLEGVAADNVFMQDDTSEIILENVIWKQEDDYTFDKGCITFLNENIFMGKYDFVYDSICTSTIESHSKWRVTNGMTLQIGRKDSTDGPEPIYFEDDTSVLRLDDCTFLITGFGISLTRGSMEVESNVGVEVIGTTTNTGLVWGSGIEGEDFYVYLNSGASLDLKSGQMIYNNYANDCLKAFSESARVVRYGASKMYIASDWIFPNLVLKVRFGAPETILKEGVTYSYDGTKIVFDEVEYSFLGHQSGSYNFHLIGDDYLYLSKGSFVAPLFVQGANNKIYGAGNFSGPVILQDSDSYLSYNLNGLVLGDVYINGSTVTLGGDLALGADAKFIGGGIVDLASYNFALSGLDSIWTSTIYWKNTDGGISLHSNVDLSGMWVFDDSCVVNGNGHNINVGQIGQIVVGDGAQLTLRDVTLHMVSQDDIQLLSDTSSIVLDNVVWVQDADITFNTGSMKFINNVEFIGAYDFHYDTSQTSTIANNSTWKITGDMTLKIGRKEAQDYVEPLYFENSASSLGLDNCTFIVTGSGMQFARGRIDLDKDVNLEIMGTTVDTGLVLGDGQEEHDFSVYLYSGLSVRFKSGQLVYNNYNSGKIFALSESARFIRYGPSKIYLATDLVFPSAYLKVDSGEPITEMAEGVSFTYDKSKIIFENVEFDFKGRQSGSSVFLLEGGDYLYLSKGLFALPFTVSGLVNQIFGSGNLAGQVELQDSNSELICYLNGVIWNKMLLNGGSLTLYDDLHLGGDFTLEGPGQVRLMRYNVILGGQDSVWTTTIDWHSNGEYPCPYNFPRGIDLNSKVTLSGKWNMQDCCVIDGHSQMLDLAGTGQIEVQDGVCLTLRNLILHTKGENNIYCTSDNSSILFDNVTWIQDSDVTFSKGSMKFENNVDFVGPHSFTYDSCKTSTIGDSSCWKITNGMTLSIGKKDQKSSEPLYFTNKTSVLKFDNCSFLVTGSGMNLTRGIVELDRDVTLDILGTTTSNGLILGNGIEEDDLTIQADSGTAFMFKSGQMVFNNYSNSLINPLSESARFIRYGPSKVYIKSNVEFPEMTLKVASGFPETVLADGVTFSYNNSHIIFSNVAFDYTGVQYHSSIFALAGGDYIYLDKGVFMLPIIVGGAYNTIFGTGSFSGPIILDDSDAELTFGLNGNVSGSVIFNGGKVSLSDNLCLSGGAHLIGAGQINLSGYRLSFGSRDVICEDAKSWDGGDDGSIDIRSRIDLRDTWTFSSSCIINGHGNTIDLSNNGEIVVAKGANLIFQDIKILGVSDSNIRCLDDDGVITLDDVTWVQDGNYTFTAGAFRVKNNTKMEGPHDFYYQTIMTTTLLKDSSWKFGPGFTFNYEPACESKDLIEFEDETSCLKFNNANMHVSSVGIGFKKGNIIARGECNFSSEILELEDETIINEGIAIGSGVVQDDCTCTISVGSILNFVQGAFIYNNISAASFIMENQISHLGILSDTELRLNQNLNLGEGILYMSEAATFNFAEGKNIIGTVFFVE